MTTSSRITLPQSKEQKQALKNQILQYIEFISASIQQQQKLISPTSKQITQQQQKVSTLNLRLRLIDKCQQFSLLRLNHLQQIFKYYCTNIFKIGKHMTFDRLEYEREHLTTERFFLFLKDFNLTLMELQGKQKEIVSKQAVMTIFKKISSNSRDLTFEEFIKCLEKLAVVYYDEKANYWTKIEEAKLERIRRKKEIEKRKIKRMKMNGQKVDEKTEQELEKLQNQEKELGGSSNLEGVQNSEKQQTQQQEDKHSPPPINQPTKQQEEQQQNYQNDDLVKQMMQDKDLEDPNQAITQITNQKKHQVMEIEKSKKNQQDYQKKLLSLTNNEKIEYFYQMIGVDSVNEHKNKLTRLSMFTFHKDKNIKPNDINHRQSKTINFDQDSQNNLTERPKSQEEEERLRKLKEKMNQKKEKRKNLPIPKPKEVKQSETSKQRRLMKEEREFRMAEKIKEKQKENEALKLKAKDIKQPENSKKPAQQENPSSSYQRPSFNQKQVNWSMLQKMSFQQLKLRQFQPNKLYHQEDDDYIFMQQYGDFKPPNKNRTSRMEARQRQSLSIVENVRKRADEVEKTQRREETKMERKITQTARGHAVKGKF